MRETDIRCRTASGVFRAVSLRATSSRDWGFTRPKNVEVSYIINYIS